jgi:hypothetical protein
MLLCSTAIQRTAISSQQSVGGLGVEAEVDGEGWWPLRGFGAGRGFWRAGAACCAAVFRSGVWGFAGCASLGQRMRRLGGLELLGGAFGGGFGPGAGGCYGDG